MATTTAGHQGGLELGVLVNLLKRTAYRQCHVAYNTVGVQVGLPPEVATVQIGEPEHGLWWNLKKGMIPEFDVRQKAQVVDDTEALMLMDKYGMSPVGKAHALGIAKYEGAKSMLNERAFKKRLPAKLLFVGWRSTLRSMIENRAVRGSSEAERLLGRKDYRAAMTTRRLRETVHYDMDW